MRCAVAAWGSIPRASWAASRGSFRQLRPHCAASPLMQQWMNGSSPTVRRSDNCNYAFEPNRLADVSYAQDGK